MEKGSFAKLPFFRGGSETQTPSAVGGGFLRVKHILVREKYQAEDVLRLLQRGEDFSQLATKWSQCPSAPMGGDLGELKGKKLDVDFEEALEALKPGELSAVVRTRFGYHLIKRES